MEQLVELPEKRKFLLAVSGGADSSVMAYLFHEIGYDFAIAHCNFHLRGEDSNRDMQLVEKMAYTLNVPVFIQEFDTLNLQKKSGLSVEMTARKLRYDWFSEIGQKYDYIVTAHQANDAAETMLLNLCRGTGLKGMISIPEKNGKIIRPMLGFTAEDIREYAQNQHIEYAVDYTNADETIKRNKIRHSIIPLLRELNPDLIHTFTRNRKIFGQQYAFYQQHINNIKNDLLKDKEHYFSIDIQKLYQQDDGQLLLYEILKDFNFNTDITEELFIHRNLQSGKQFRSTSHILVVNRYEWRIYPIQNIDNNNITIKSLAELKILFKVEHIINDGTLKFVNGNDSLYLPDDKLKFPLLLRNWQKGDYFCPLGGKGKQKLSDFFTDHKIDIIERQQVKLLCYQNDIIWIVGFRSDDRYKINPQNTNYYYKITLL